MVFIMHTFQLLEPLQKQNQHSNKNQEISPRLTPAYHQNDLKSFIKITEEFLQTRLTGIEAISSGKVSDDSSSLVEKIVVGGFTMASIGLGITSAVSSFGGAIPPILAAASFAAASSSTAIHSYASKQRKNLDAIHSKVIKKLLSKTEHGQTLLYKAISELEFDITGSKREDPEESKFISNIKTKLPSIFNISSTEKFNAQAKIFALFLLQECAKIDTYFDDNSTNSQLLSKVSDICKMDRNMHDEEYLEILNLVSKNRMKHDGDIESYTNQTKKAFLQLVEKFQELIKLYPQLSEQLEHNLYHRAFFAVELHNCFVDRKMDIFETRYVIPTGTEIKLKESFLQNPKMLRLFFDDIVVKIGDQMNQFAALTSIINNGSIAQIQDFLDKHPNFDLNWTDKSGNGLLISALKTGDISKIKAILENPKFLKSEINRIPNNIEQTLSPLFWAVQNSNSNIVKLLLDHGADVAKLDNNKHSCLTYAVTRQDRETNDDCLKILDLLLAAPSIKSVINVKTPNTFPSGTKVELKEISPILFASTMQRHEFMDKLLKAGADPYLEHRQEIDGKSVDQYGNTISVNAVQQLLSNMLLSPQAAAFSAKYSILDSLLEKFDRPESQNILLMLTLDLVSTMPASRNDIEAVAKYLIGHSKINLGAKAPNGDNALHIAIQKDFIDVAKVIIQTATSTKAGQINFSDQDNFGDTALHSACKHLVNLDNTSPSMAGTIDLIAKLVPISGIDILNKDKKTILHFAVERGAESLTEYIMFLDGENILLHTSDERGFTPLHTAIEFGRSQIFELLIAGISGKFTHKTKEGSNILHYALEKYAEIANLGKIAQEQRNLYGTILGTIIRLQAVDLEELNGKGLNISLLAAACGDEIMVQVFSQNFGIPLIMEDSGITALHICQDPELLTILLNGQLQGRINAQIITGEFAGMTPLHFACKNGSPIETIKILKNNQAQCDLQDTKGRSPIFYAIAADRIEIFQELMNSSNCLNVRDEKQMNAFEFMIKSEAKSITEYILKTLNTDIQFNPIKFALEQNASLDFIGFLIDTCMDKIWEQGAAYTDSYSDQLAGYYAISNPAQAQSREKEIVKLFIRKLGVDSVDNVGSQRIDFIGFLIDQCRDKIWQQGLTYTDSYSDQLAGYYAISNPAQAQSREKETVTPSTQKLGVDSVDNVSSQRHGILFQAVMLQDLDMVKFLIERNIDPNKQYPMEGAYHHLQALHMALKMDLPEIAKEILTSKRLQLNLGTELHGHLLELAAGMSSSELFLIIWNRFLAHPEEITDSHDKDISSNLMHYIKNPAQNHDHFFHILMKNHKLSAEERISLFSRIEADFSEEILIKLALQDLDHNGNTVQTIIRGDSSLNQRYETARQEFYEAEKAQFVGGVHVPELAKQVQGLSADVYVLKNDVTELKHDVTELKHDVAELKHDVSTMRTEFSSNFERLFGMMEDLQHDMKQLHDSHLKLAGVVEQHISHHNDGDFS
jgi:ankyrin repeat protein